VAAGVLLGMVFTFALIRFATDWPHLRAGTVPEQDFAKRYVDSPWIPYLHIGFGLVYLAGAPVQLIRRVRVRSYARHRILGRVLVGCGLLSGGFAVVFAILAPWGGLLELTATLVFGTWFILCLVRAFHAIRTGNVHEHRRWMIRAFAVGLGIGSIRVWWGIFTGILLLQPWVDDILLPDPTTLGISFWLGFLCHVVVGEWWLRRFPVPPD
jgi:uncharacterized membrane protein